MDTMQQFVRMGSPAVAQQKLILTLYVVAGSHESDGLIEALNKGLSETMPADEWKMEVIDVVAMPHKAMENDIFVTPTLVREMPGPIMKFMGAISNTQNILAVINNNHAENPSVIIV